jgi:hypothetical protein
MTHLAFIDTETAGLDRLNDPIWELALIIEGHPDETKNGEYVWEFPIIHADADAIALKISGWYERSVQWTKNDGRDSTVRTGAITSSTVVRLGEFAWRVQSPSKIAGQYTTGRPVVERISETLYEIHELTRGAHLVGAVPDFDAYRLEDLLREGGLLKAWHYHLVDVEALMVGYLAGKAAAWYEDPPNDTQWGPETPGLPWKSKDLAEKIGVDNPTAEEEHTALGDARWARRIYKKIMGDA